MIDIHTHILPGIDDGSRSMETSMKMARTAVESGVRTLVATPHFYTDAMTDDYYRKLIYDRYRILVEAVQKEKLPIEILLGTEVFGTVELPMLLKSNRLLTLNQTGYLLVEFGFREDPALYDCIIQEILNQNYRPIIAHPERYLYIQRYPDIVAQWIAMGCSIQINKGSLFGDFGRTARKTALHLLENDQVSLIASDAHDTHRRTTDLSEVYQFLEKYFTKEYADLLLETNPKLVVEDKQLSMLWTASIEDDF